jgi:hypothetical protein
MFSIVVAIGPSSDKISLLYKTKEAADSCLGAIAEAVEIAMLNKTEDAAPVATLNDDFGQVVIIRADKIHAVIFEDMDLSAESQIERGLHQARTQAKAQTRASADPGLRASQIVGTGAGRGPWNG